MPNDAASRGDPPWLMRPSWRVGPAVRAQMSLRCGGSSPPPWQGFNLGVSVGDEPQRVAAHRQAFAQALGAAPVWLRQVHGTRAVYLSSPSDAQLDISADAAWTDVPGVAPTVQAADCMPVLVAAPQGRAVGAAHAGWRGLAAGVLPALLAPMCEAAACAPAELSVWLGPCIGPRHFEVGEDVWQAFGCAADQPDAAFSPRARGDGQMRWLADLPLLAKRQLRALGVRRLSGGRCCTAGDASRFYSFRRDARTGRMAAAICIVD